MPFAYSPSHFDALGATLVKSGNHYGHWTVPRRTFLAIFGVSAYVCSIIWEYLIEEPRRLRGAKPIHLMWALMFLKLYNIEETNAIICQCDVQTFRKWVAIVMRALASLDVVSAGTSMALLFAAFIN
jgi:hypothetical protein